MRKKMFSRKKNNKGFSLIELLVALSILAVISLTLVTFMGSSSRTYTRTSTEATLQAEAQVVANAISDRIIDCTENIDYSTTVLNNVDGLPSNSLDGGTRFGDSVNGEVLQIINENTKSILLLDRKEKVIYYMEVSRDMADPDKKFPKFSYGDESDYSNSDRQILAEHVTEFKVNKDRYANEHILWFQLTYEKNNKSYTGTYQVNIRNHITLDAGDPDATPDTTLLQSLYVSPAVQYVNLINGLPYDEKYDPNSSTGNPNNPDNHIPVLTELVFTVSGKPSTVPLNEVSWSVSTTGTGLTFSTEEAKKHPVARPTLSSKADDYKHKNFKVTAECQGKSAYGMVYIRKVTGVNVSSSSGLTSGTDSITGAAIKTTGRRNAVNLNAGVNGWNLEKQHKYVKWTVLYKESVGGTYKELSSYSNSSDIATTAVIGNNFTVTVGAKAEYGSYFQVVATSVFDESQYGAIEFSVQKKTSSDGNKVFARGMDMDLAAIFETFGLHDDDCAQFLWAALETMSGINEQAPANPDNHYSKDNASLYINGNILYFESPPNNIMYSGDDLVNYYYSAKQGDITVEYVSEDGTIKKWTAIKYFYPEVRLFKTSVDLLDEVHEYNDTHYKSNAAGYPNDACITGGKNEGNIIHQCGDSFCIDHNCNGDHIIQDMMKLDDTTKNIVIAKGTSKALRFYLQGYNITDKNMIGVYINASGNKRGTNIATGNAGASSYFSASLTSSIGSRKKLQDNGVITLKAVSEKTSKYYPTDMIPLRVCLDEYYLLKKTPDTRSYTEYNVYIANVEGSNIFIPTPDSSQGWPTNVGNTAQDYTMGPGNVLVKLWKDKNDGSYRMKYNNTTFIYNTTYHYWAEQ